MINELNLMIIQLQVLWMLNLNASIFLIFNMEIWAPKNIEGAFMSIRKKNSGALQILMNTSVKNMHSLQLFIGNWPMKL